MTATPAQRRGRPTLSFLEARRILASFTGERELAFLLAISGTAEPFQLYLEAAGAQAGRRVAARTLPFNTLGQHLSAPPTDGETEVFLLFPWDLAPETDWRAGVLLERADADTLLARARDFSARVARRPNARVLYVPARIPPTTGTAAGDRGLELSLAAIAAEFGATALPPETMTMASLLSTGCPVGGAWLGTVAEAIVGAAVAPVGTRAKVLVTDLDNTLWNGVIAEDGMEGVAWSPDGKGFPHFIYQTYLARLRREGTLLAAVTRNDPDVALGPLRAGRMPLSTDDFVAVLASYHPKSAQLRALAQQLNLGLDALVFVDDNPVELEEVARALPEVRCLRFPEHADGLPELLAEIARHVAQPSLTDEDRDRTALYRRRLDGIVPTEAEGADVAGFLATLSMQLTLDDRSAGDRTRAVQLINKTNQFNLNGRRWSDAEVGALLAQGGRLFTASLADRSGSHGEIAALLIGPDRTAEAFVLSCRVFERRVEHAMLAALGDLAPVAFRYAPTERNEPLRRFVADAAFSRCADGALAFDAGSFAEHHAADLALFRVARW